MACLAVEQCTPEKVTWAVSVGQSCCGFCRQCLAVRPTPSLHGAVVFVLQAWLHAWSIWCCPDQCALQEQRTVSSGFESAVPWAGQLTPVSWLATFGVCTVWLPCTAHLMTCT